MFPHKKYFILISIKKYIKIKYTLQKDQMFEISRQGK